MSGRAHAAFAQDPLLRLVTTSAPPPSSPPLRAYARIQSLAETQSRPRAQSTSLAPDLRLVAGSVTPLRSRARPRLKSAQDLPPLPGPRPARHSLPSSSPLPPLAAEEGDKEDEDQPRGGPFAPLRARPQPRRIIKLHSVSAPEAPPSTPAPPPSTPPLTESPLRRPRPTPPPTPPPFLLSHDLAASGHSATAPSLQAQSPSPPQEQEEEEESPPSLSEGVDVAEGALRPTGGYTSLLVQYEQLKMQYAALQHSHRALSTRTLLAHLPAPTPPTPTPTPPPPPHPEDRLRRHSLAQRPRPPPALPPGPQ